MLAIQEIVSESDINDIIACSRIAKVWAWRKLFYALKDLLLRIYGYFDGYDLQVWQDMDGYSEIDQVYAEHKHVLARYRLNGHLFHIPTNEFYYFNFEYQSDKYSKNFFELAGQYHELIQGKCPLCFEREAHQQAWSALKRLVKRHGYLLKER